MTVLRLHRPADRRDHCPHCGGTGTTVWFDADTGFDYQPCRHCDGTATAGVFVLRTVVGEHEVERSWHTSHVEFAVERARRLAYHLARVLAPWPLRAEVHVRYVPFDGPVGPTVHAEAVPAPAPRLFAPRVYQEGGADERSRLAGVGGGDRGHDRGRLHGAG